MNYFKEMPVEINKPKLFQALCKTRIGALTDTGWKLSHPIVETHFHLDYLKMGTIEEIMSLVQQIGIEKAITISVSAENINSVIDLAQANANLFTTQGIHPHHAKQWTEDLKSQLKTNAQKPKVVAIGEIGLDYYYNHSPQETQREVFRQQLELSIQLDLPVIIHTRDADEDTLSILKDFLPQLKRKGVIHSFTSGNNLLKFALENDFYIGFNGIITFKGAENVRQALTQTPVERILLETDAPFLTPMPFRGSENAPIYLPFIAEYISSYKNIDPKTLLLKAYENTHNLFYKLQ